MSATIKEHAIRQYLKRVKGMSPSMATVSQWKEARSFLNEIVEDPDRVEHNKEELPQLHIKGDAVAPVGVPLGESGKFRPYTEEDEKLAIPTVYNAKEFMGGRYDDRKTKGA